MINKYKENPTIDTAKKNTVFGRKVIFANQDKKITTEIYTNSEDDDININSINFSTTIKVDKDEFIKLYISALPAFASLKKSSKLIFQYVLLVVNNGIGKDKIHLSYNDYLEKTENSLIPKLSRASYFNGIKELLENEILFQSLSTNMYWINIAYIFNGDRLKFIQQYDLIKNNEEKDNE
jgi:hypothetical protein